MTLPFGIDVSSYQKSMDWQRAIFTGAKFAFVKATEGSTWVDPTFAANWSELRRLGLPHGAYHFFRPAQSLSQIELFVNTVQPEEGERLVLDAENNGGLDKYAMTLRLKDALEIVKLRTGRYPIVYSRASWMNSNLIMSHLPVVDYWLAQYRFANPYPFFTEPYPSDKITIPAGVSREQVKFHQSSEKGNGKRRGAQSYYIDLDTYIGTEDGLAAYFGAAIVPDEHEVYLPIVITPPAPQPSGNLQVEPFSQNDPRWKNNRLGTSSTTIGWNGCLITCHAMIAKYFGKDTDPAKFNTWLTANNGYWNGNLYVWNSLHRLYPDIDINVWEDCIYVPAPLSQIDACLGRGEPVIVHVDFVPSTNPIDDHYVLLIGKLGADDYVMIDSWDGWQGSFKSRYIDAKRFIYRIVSYRRQ
jgi:GH25 family lysozyme M1 (1,4-beta-N-acetylmuramidase)